MKKINCILLVDDNASDNAYHKIIIETVGICNHIKIATDGQKALDYLLKAFEPNPEESYPIPDLIFLDINMPRMNGYEFLDEYKKFKEKVGKIIMIVMLTTSSNPDDRTKSLEKNVKEFLIKPLTGLKLQEIIDQNF